MIEGTGIAVGMSMACLSLVLSFDTLLFPMISHLAHYIRVHIRGWR